MKTLINSDRAVVVLAIIFSVAVIVMNYCEIRTDSTKHDSYNTQQIESMDIELVNINEANIELLCTLPFVGAHKAQSIIDYRTEHGRFESIEQIEDVKGFGRNDYLRLAPLITVE